MAVLLAGAGCAGPAAAPAPVAAAATGGLIGDGIVVSVRQVSASSGSAGINAVLAALGQPAAPAGAAGTEYVIMRDDGNGVSLGQAGGAAASEGDRVVILDGDPVTLARR